MNFNKELQRLRKSEGLSQEELGEKLGVSRQTISKWEGGSAYPDMLNLMTISQFFNVTVDELINGAEDNSIVHESAKTEESDDEFNEIRHEAPHFEYKSNACIKGMPLVHINCGIGTYRAKGVLAIGNISTGMLSVGIIAKGFLTVGVLSLGLFAVGVLSLGMFVVGCLGAGIISVAGIAFGVMTLGGVAMGVVSIGGCALSTHISVGGVAIAPVSVGFIVKGDSVMTLKELGEISRVSAESVELLIAQQFPNLPAILKSWATLLFM